VKGVPVRKNKNTIAAQVPIPLQSRKLLWVMIKSRSSAVTHRTEARMRPRGLLFREVCRMESCS
jgi:hypothetical protein